MPHFHLRSTLYSRCCICPWTKMINNMDMVSELEYSRELILLFYNRLKENQSIFHVCSRKTSKKKVGACYKLSCLRGSVWEGICRCNLLKSVSTPVEVHLERRLAKGKTWAVLQYQQRLQPPPQINPEDYMILQIFPELGQGCQIFNSLALTSR